MDNFPIIYLSMFNFVFLMMQRCGGGGFWKMDGFRFCMDNFPEWVLVVRLG
jgi:hypothetical protein